MAYLRKAVVLIVLLVAVPMLQSCNIGKTQPDNASKRTGKAIPLMRAVNDGAVTAEFRVLDRGAGDIIEARFTAKSSVVKQVTIAGGECLKFRNGSGTAAIVLAKRAKAIPVPSCCVLRAFQLTGTVAAKTTDLELAGSAGDAITELMESETALSEKDADMAVCQVAVWAVEWTNLGLVTDDRSLKKEVSSPLAIPTRTRLAKHWQAAYKLLHAQMAQCSLSLKPRSMALKYRACGKGEWQPMKNGGHLVPGDGYGFQGSARDCETVVWEHRCNISRGKLSLSAELIRK